MTKKKEKVKTRGSSFLASPHHFNPDRLESWRKITMPKTQPQKIEDWEKKFNEEVSGKMWLLDSKENVILAYDHIKSFISKLLKSEKEKLLEELAGKLNRIIEKGAPSEQDNPIKYGAEIWNKIHELIRELLKKK